MLTHIDLFSGIGGFALAAQWAGFKTVAFVEIEPYAQAIIEKNFGAVADTESVGSEQAAERRESEQSMPELGCPAIYSDILQFDGTRYRGATLLTGGFPCQPFSQAGKRRGAADDRAIWPEMFRVICEARPAWVIGENVAGIVNMELDRCISDLEGEGYAVQPLIIPACAVDAKHRRDRVWIVAHVDRIDRERGSGERGGPEESGPRDRTSRSSEHAEYVADDVEHANSGGFNDCLSKPEGARRRMETSIAGASETVSHANGKPLGWPTEPRSECCEWLPEPDVGRVAHGIPKRVDRLKGLGNAIVPQVAFEIIKEIARIEAKPTPAASR